HVEVGLEGEHRGQRRADQGLVVHEDHAQRRIGRLRRLARAGAGFGAGAGVAGGAHRGSPGGAMRTSWRNRSASRCTLSAEVSPSRSRIPVRPLPSGTSPWPGAPSLTRVIASRPSVIVTTEGSAWRRMLVPASRSTQAAVPAWRAGTSAALPWI